MTALSITVNKLAYAVALSPDTAANLLFQSFKSFSLFVTFVVAYYKANHNYSVQYTLASTLQNVADGLADYDQLILVQKQAIATADENIANAASIVSEEQAIANQEKLIASLENSLAVNEPIYNDYLAQIKALVGDSAE